MSQASLKQKPRPRLHGSVAGLGTEAQDSETLTAAAQPTITKCHEGKYTKYYYEGVVQSVDTAHCAWSDQQGGSYNHCGYIDHSNAIIGTGKGLEPYTPPGSGFQKPAFSVQNATQILRVTKALPVIMTRVINRVTPPIA